MKWEYKVIEGSLSPEELNTLGAEGWELIQVTGGIFSNTHMIFKRLIN